MERLTIRPRANWRKTVEAQGLEFHSPDETTYWDESVYYRFTSAQIDEIEKATYALDKMCLEAVERIVEGREFDRFQIPPAFHDWIARSWERDELTVMGRFDLAYDGAGPPKLLEYNADTPTSLLEAAVIQWTWMKETGHGSDQFNSIHERLIEAWGALSGDHIVHFTGITDDIEDFVTLTYLRDVAQQAGLRTVYIDIERLGWDHRLSRFVDEANQPVERCFKLYPWEWMIRESFGPYLANDRVGWLEAPWKMLLSNKEILVVLSEMFPESPYLLRTGRHPVGDSFVKKPILSRQGANVAVVRDGAVVQENDGPYGEQTCVYQELAELPDFDGFHPVLGSWMVNGYACGMGIREDDSLITGNTSRFVPHVMS